MYMYIYIYIYIYICIRIYIYIYIYPHLVHARLCNGSAASLPWKLLRAYLVSCANIVQAVVSALFVPGDTRHVVRPSVVMILVSSTRSSHACDESWIPTKSPAGISWSRNQFFSIASGVSCSRRRPGLYADVGIEGASHRMLLRMNSAPFLSIGLLTMSG